MTTNQNNTEVLRQEILADARREGEETILRATREAEAFLNRSAAEADRIGQELLDQARSEATRQSGLIMAAVPVETGRLRAARMEALLESVYEEACRRLQAREGFEYRETVISLASHAIDRMEGNAFVVRLSEGDRETLGDGLAEAIIRSVGRSTAITISYEPDFAEGGVIVEDAEVRQVWDNRLLKRLDRLWPELKRQIAVDENFVPKTGSRGDGP